MTGRSTEMEREVSLKDVLCDFLKFFPTSLQLQLRAGISIKFNLNAQEPFKLEKQVQIAAYRHYISAFCIRFSYEGG